MGIMKDLGKVGLGGVAGIVANKGMLPKFSGIGMLQRELGMGKKRRDKKGAVGKPGDAEPVMAMEAGEGMRKGGKVKKMAKGGSASRRADGCATQGKTKGKFV